ncbi:hypothetical protein CTAYLR_006410 [Chrysophaeum taylorii]|uniref:EF-hand domain-containing protein n=1 Tax=Chrysophaeum taylorii TaxID=2483200 RepID=A0AAD7U9J5_9STRA|nr:hypothetical protein CTAYLR_006410 [Chrysophaeum taylorii]
MKLFTTSLRKGKEIKGKTPLMKVMREYKMTNPEASKILLLLEKIDADHNGLVDFDEFLQFLELNKKTTEIEKQFLLLEVFMAVEPPGMTDFLKVDIKKKFEMFQKARIRLEYVEFFVALYNFNTLDHQGMVRFTFDMLDTDRSGHLRREEIENLVRVFLREKERRVETKVKQLMFFLDEDNSGGIEFDEFLRLHGRMSLLMFPVFRLQIALRKKLLGESYWRRATKLRRAVYEETGQSPTDIYFFVVGRKVPAAAVVVAIEDDEQEKTSGREEEDEEIVKDDADTAVTTAAEDLEEEENRERLDPSLLLFEEEEEKEKEEERQTRSEAVDAVREGPWWVEDRGTGGRLDKSLVGAETASVLDAAERARDRAQSLNSNAEARASLLDKLGGRSAAYVVVVAPRRRRRCCCCWHAPRRGRTYAANNNSQTSPH